MGPIIYLNNLHVSKSKSLGLRLAVGLAARMSSSPCGAPKRRQQRSSSSSRSDGGAYSSLCRQRLRSSCISHLFYRRHRSHRVSRKYVSFPTFPAKHCERNTKAVTRDERLVVQYEPGIRTFQAPQPTWRILVRNIDDFLFRSLPPQ